MRTDRPDTDADPQVAEKRSLHAQAAVLGTCTCTMVLKEQIGQLSCANAAVQEPLCTRHISRSSVTTTQGQFFKATDSIPSPGS